MINFNSKIFVAGHNGLVGSAIVNRLKDKGYKLARRTVAKYRDQLGVPVARLRKEI